MLTLVALLSLSQLPSSHTFTNCSPHDFAVPGLQRIALGGTEVAAVSATGTGLRVTPLAAGHITVIVWLSDNRRLTMRVVVAAGLKCSGPGSHGTRIYVRAPE